MGAVRVAVRLDVRAVVRGTVRDCSSFCKSRAYGFVGSRRTLAFRAFGFS